MEKWTRVKGRKGGEYRRKRIVKEIMESQRRRTEE